MLYTGDPIMTELYYLTHRYNCSTGCLWPAGLEPDVYSSQLITPITHYFESK